jgi:hypothetical protein
MCGNTSSTCVGTRVLHVWEYEFYMCGNTSSTCVGIRVLHVWVYEFYLWEYDIYKNDVRNDVFPEIAS